MAENEHEQILDDLMKHFPNTRRVDTAQRLKSISFALKLPLTEGASWALDNGSFYTKYDGWWQATIHDYPRGYLTQKQDRELAVAICKVWLAWKLTIDNPGDDGL